MPRPNRQQLETALQRVWVELTMIVGDRTLPIGVRIIIAEVRDRMSSLLFYSGPLVG